MHDYIIDLEIQKVVIKELVEYTVVHFETEEKYMMKFNFSGYDEHKKEHEKLTEKAINIQNAFKETNCLIPFSILDILKDWLEIHFLNMDMKYVHCFNENELH